MGLYVAVQERLKKTNKLVKKASKSNGDAAKEGILPEGSTSKGEKSPNLKALLKGLSGKSGTSNGGGREASSRSGVQLNSEKQ